MIFDYKLFNNKNGELSATGRTTHCFATPELKPISIKHSNSDYYNRLRDNIVDTEDVTIKGNNFINKQKCVPNFGTHFFDIGK